MNIQKTVISIIASTLNVDGEVVTTDLSVGDIEEWDSMGNVAVLAAIEEQLGLDFPMDDLFELTSVESIVNKVKELKHV